MTQFKLVLGVLLAVNLAVLTIFFAHPRIRFIATHAVASHEEILASPGPRDAPNFNREKFLITVQQLQRRTESHATLVFANDFPPGYIYRYLYPRSIAFAYSTDEFERHVSDGRDTPLYIINQSRDFDSTYLQGLAYHDLSGGWRMALVDTAVR